MNQEMPVVARSTSTQYSTCSLYPYRQIEENPHIYTHAHTHTHMGSLWCVCVSVCEHLFRIRHLASFGRTGCTIEAPWTVISLAADQYPSRQLIILRPTHTQEIRACNHMNISPLIEYSRKHVFSSRFQLELMFTAG